MNTLRIYFLNGTEIRYELNAANYAFVAAQLLGTLHTYVEQHPQGRQRCNDGDGRSLSAFLEIPKGDESDFLHPASILRVTIKVDERQFAR